MKGIVKFNSKTGKKTITKEFPEFTLTLWKYPDDETHFQYVYKGDIPSDETIQLFINANLELIELEPHERKLLSL